MERLARKEREFKIRRMEILETAEKMFAAKGFYNVTMAEIAKASGFSTGSLYHFFQGKENLYSNMITEKLNLMYGQIQSKVRGTEGIVGKIDTLIAVHFQFVEDNTDFCRLFLRGENAAPTEIMDSLRQSIMESFFYHLAFIEKELKVGIDNGFLRPLPAHNVARVLFGLIRFSIVDWLLFNSQVSLSSQKDFIREIFLQGVRQNEE